MNHVSLFYLIVLISCSAQAQNTSSQPLYEFVYGISTKCSLGLEPTACIEALEPLSEQYIADVQTNLDNFHKLFSDFRDVDQEVTVENEYKVLVTITSDLISQIVTSIQEIGSLLTSLNGALGSCGAKDLIELFLAIAVQVANLDTDAVAVWRILTQVYKEISAFVELATGLASQKYVQVGAATMDLILILFPATSVVCKSSQNAKLSHSTIGGCNSEIIGSIGTVFGLSPLSLGCSEMVDEGAPLLDWFSQYIFFCSENITGVSGDASYSLNANVLQVSVTDPEMSDIRQTVDCLGQSLYLAYFDYLYNCTYDLDYRSLFFDFGTTLYNNVSVVAFSTNKPFIMGIIDDMVTNYNQGDCYSLGANTGILMTSLVPSIQPLNGTTIVNL